MGRTNKLWCTVRCLSFTHKRHLKSMSVQIVLRWYGSNGISIDMSLIDSWDLDVTHPFAFAKDIWIVCYNNCTCVLCHSKDVWYILLFWCHFSGCVLGTLDRRALRFDRRDARHEFLVCHYNSSLGALNGTTVLLLWQPRTRNQTWLKREEHYRIS